MRLPLREYGRLLTQYLRPEWLKTTALAVLLLAGTGLQLLGPQIIRQFIDGALAGAAMETLVQTALWFIGVGLVTQVVSVGTTYLGQDVVLVREE